MTDFFPYTILFLVPFFVVVVFSPSYLQWILFLSHFRRKIHKKDALGIKGPHFEVQKVP